MIYYYLSRLFLRLFALALISFFIVLFVLKLDEVVQFAIISSSIKEILLFTLFQSPTFLALIIPLSSLIAAYLLFHNLSRNHELTALRAGGLSIATICKPLIFFSTLFSICTLLMTCNLIPTSRTASKNLLISAIQKNPRSLLASKSAFHNDNLFIMKGKKLRFFSTEEMKVETGELIAQKVAMIGTEPLIVENYESVATPVHTFIKDEKSEADHCTLRHLIKYKDSQWLFELVRRFSLSFSPLILTLLGIAYGISVERKVKRRDLLALFLFSAFFYTCFFSAKRIPHHAEIAIPLFIAPYLILPLFSTLKLRKIG